MGNTSELLLALDTQRQNLAANLSQKGVAASSNEGLETLVPKVLDISGGGTDAEAILASPKMVEGLNYGGLLDEYLPNDKLTLVVNPKTKTNGLENIFYQSTPADELDLTINCENLNDGNSPLSNFLWESDIKKLNFHMTCPKDKNYYVAKIYRFCCYCDKLREVNDDIFDFVDVFTKRPINTPESLFLNCYNLRKMPKLDKIQGEGFPYGVNFDSLHSLRELETPITLTTTPSKFSLGGSHIQSMFLLRRLKFINPQNIVYTSLYNANSYYKTLDLSYYVGYCHPNYVDRMDEVVDGTLPLVTDDATYQQYKNTDYYTTDLYYSHYNKPAAIETLRSLPDMSHVNNGTPIIIFSGFSGFSTDGGPINSMTNDEIAIATSKNWAVQFV